METRCNEGVTATQGESETLPTPAVASRPTLDLAALCRLDESIVACVREGRELKRIGLWAGKLTLVGGAMYGFVFGLWRAPEQALYAALKLPLLLFAVVLASACINGLLALLFRARIGIAQGLVAILLSLSMAAVLLGAIAPVSLLFVLSVPGPHHPTATPFELYQTAEYVLFFHVLVVGLCGVAGNVRLYRLLNQLTPSRRIAHRVFVSWLVVDGFVGTQLSWILRPFLCKPTLQPELLRSDALNGNFFEELARIIGPAGVIAHGAFACLLALGWWLRARRTPDQPARFPRPAAGPYRSARTSAGPGQ